jgi:hypothetical protein
VRFEAHSGVDKDSSFLERYAVMAKILKIQKSILALKL